MVTMDIVEVSRHFPFISTISPPTWAYRDPLPNSNVDEYIQSQHNYMPLIPPQNKTLAA